MKVFVMAAGIGTRLRPLTYHIPKPLVPIVNIPVIGHLMRNLSDHGINKVMVNLHYYPNMITSYLNEGKRWDLEIKYSYEKNLLGTAGGVKLQEKFFDDTFIVTSADGLSDINFTKLIKYHKTRKAIATIALKSIDMKLEYGVVETDKKLKIKNFVEKPSWGNIFSDYVNTGIYILEPEIFRYIPKNTMYDFGKQLLPKLVEKGLPVYGYLMNEYWCDVGNLREYKRAQHDCLDGKVKVVINGEQIAPNVWIGKNTKIPKSLKIEPPVVIGRGVKLGKNCSVGNYSIIGSMSEFGNSVKINDSVLWSKVKVKSRVNLNSCIIGHSAVVSESISMFEGAVLNVKI